MKQGGNNQFFILLQIVNKIFGLGKNRKEK